MGVWDKLNQGLTKTKQLFNTDIRDLFKGQGRLVDETFLAEVLADLIKTDMGVEPAKQIAAELDTAFRGRVVRMYEFREKFVKAQLNHLSRHKEET